MFTVPLITPNSISEIDGLPARPVFFLNLNGATSPNLVVKGEQKGNMNNQDLDITIPWGSKLMKNVQHKMVNTKIMLPAEIQVFKAAVQAKFKSDTNQFNVAVNGSADFKWVKMPYVQGIKDLDIRTEKKETYGSYTVTVEGFDVRKLKKTIQKLMNDALWVELGKIVAVDIFNGNNDRFNLTTGRWSNFGNIMLLNGGASNLIGLDTFDPTSSTSTANLAKRGIFPELRALVEPQKMNEFAVKCARGTGTSLQEAASEYVTFLRMRIDGAAGAGVMELPINTLPEFFVPYAPCFQQGLARGANDLKAYLQRKVAQYGLPAAPVAAPPAAPMNRGLFANHRNPPPRPAVAAPKTLPPGVLDRMKYLGWA